MNFGSGHLDESVSSEESVTHVEFGGGRDLTAEHNFEAVFENIAASELKEPLTFSIRQFKEVLLRADDPVAGIVVAEPDGTIRIPSL